MTRFSTDFARAMTAENKVKFERLNKLREVGCLPLLERGASTLQRECGGTGSRYARGREREPKNAAVLQLALT